MGSLQLIGMGLWLITAPLVRSQSASGIEGCTLITAEDVEAVIGEKLSRKPRDKRSSLLGVESYGCNYKSAGWTIEVRLETGRTKEEVAGYLKNLKGVVKGTTNSDARAVRGLGEEAWWGPINPTNGMLTVAKGADVLWVQTYGKGAGAGSLEKTQALMEKVLGNYQRVRKS